ncbi:NAD(P)H-dependent oxidoreductase [Rosenbergiella epipactidis]|uniref:NAD(P)H-dependent oxidoreductase n=1 Tax=Rosenbergiella epipactidis TaxID=1544694 RepID=UPI001F4D81C0
MKTLIIVSHPYPDNSTAIKTLENSCINIPSVAVRNLESIYGNNVAKINVTKEQAACEEVDRIVFMFPIHWFNLTPMLKAYLNEVWTYGWAFGPGGNALKDKEMLVVTTAGASSHMYSESGLIQSTIEDVLTPIKASALYVGMKYTHPLYLFDAMNASEEKLADFSLKVVGTITA